MPYFAFLWLVLRFAHGLAAPLERADASDAWRADSTQVHIHTIRAVLACVLVRVRPARSLLVPLARRSRHGWHRCRPAMTCLAR